MKFGFFVKKVLKNFGNCWSCMLYLSYQKGMEQIGKRNKAVHIGSKEETESGWLKGLVLSVLK